MTEKLLNEEAGKRVPEGVKVNLRAEPCPSHCLAKLPAGESSVLLRSSVGWEIGKGKVYLKFAVNCSRFLQAALQCSGVV